MAIRSNFLSINYKHIALLIQPCRLAVKASIDCPTLIHSHTSDLIDLNLRELHFEGEWEDGVGLSAIEILPHCFFSVPFPELPAPHHNLGIREGVEKGRGQRLTIGI